MSVDVATVWYTTIALVVTAFVGLAFGPWFKDLWIRPKLRIAFKFGVGSVCSHQTKMKKTVGEKGKEETLYYKVYYFAFVVRNKGGSHAEDCEAILEGAWKTENGERVGQNLMPIPVNFMWAPGGSENRILKTISRNGRRLCNIGHIEPKEYQPLSSCRDFHDTEQGMNRFLFELPRNQHFYYQWDCLLPGEYLLLVSTYARNAKKVAKEFRVRWSGKWSDTEKEMFENITMCCSKARWGLWKGCMP